MNVFSNLTYNVTNGVVSSAMSMGFNGINEIMGINRVKGQEIDYYYNYKPGANFWSVHSAPILRAAAQYAKQYAIDQVKKLLKGKVQGREDSAWSTLIKDYGDKVRQKHYGMLQVNRDGGGEDYIPAVDNYGELCPYAFIMGIKLKEPIAYKMQSRIRGGRIGQKRLDVNMPTQTDMLVWFDPLAIPQMNSDKNVILTPVQGRDFTRKEIVGNGDIKFSVSGKMCSGVPGVYPEDQVRKFKQIMDYKGLVYCNHYILDILGIDKFIITGWSLSPRQGYGDNTQDYTFSAVGVMPDEVTKVEADTINIVDYSIQQAEKTKKGAWAQLVQKKLEGLQNGALDSLNKGLDKGINSLI